MYIDSHTHISEKYYKDITKVIKAAEDNDVKYLILSCCEMSEIKEGLELAQKYNNIFLSIGLHPSESKEYTDDDLAFIEKIAKNNSKVVAIGECGLDYHYDTDDKQDQLVLFEKQLTMAEKLDLPVVVHTRDAVQDTLRMLKKHKNRGIIHCFNGSKEVMNEYLKLGYKLGIGGVVTFKNTRLGETLKETSLSNILLETDSPYLSPEPLRGTVNESKNIPLIAKKLSDIFEINISEVEKITANNTFELFDLKKHM